MTDQLEDVDNFREESLIDDDAETDDSVPPLRYDISSYGADFDVEGLVRRLNREDILIPGWQRNYVWTHRLASGFVESLLLGLPVPGVFLGRYEDSGKLFVIDGQQRLRTLQYFYKGIRPDLPVGNTSEFKLLGVQARFEGLTYQSLDDKDRRILDDSLIHATVVRQESPPENDTSIYHIFQRLNNGGRSVTPQEIRRAVFHGRLIDRIEGLNSYADWRKMLGNPNRRLKDQEMILRFMAMLHEGDNYKSSMSRFLNEFTLTNRNPDKAWLDDTSDLFKETISSFAHSVGHGSFRLNKGRAINAAVFDSMSVGLARRIRDIGEPSPEIVMETYDTLIGDEDYLQYVTQSTSLTVSVEHRLKLSSIAFKNAK